MTKFIFEEDAKLEVQKIIEEIVSEYNRLSSELSTIIEEVFSRTKYEKLGIFANRFFETYNEEILGVIITNTVNTWLSSQTTFLEYARSMSMGESAEAFAQTINEVISDGLSDLKEIELLQLTTDGQIDIGVTDFMKLSNAIKDAVRRSDDICRQSSSAIDRFIENNQAMYALKPVLGMIVKVFLHFSSALDRSFEAFAENFEARLKQTEDAVSQAAGTTENTVSGAEPGSGNGSVDLSSVDLSGIAGVDLLGGAGTGRSGRAGTGKKAETGASAGRGTGAGAGGRAGRTPGCFKELKKYADLHLKQISPDNTEKLFEYVYDTVFNELNTKHTKMPYDIVRQLMPVFEDFYQSQGDMLQWKAANARGYSSREGHANREYTGVLTERDIFKHFTAEEKAEFISGCGKDYKVFSLLAKAVSKMCEGLAKKLPEVSELNLSYALYVCTEVLRTTTLQASDSYAQFSLRTGKKLYEVIGEPVPQTEVQKAAENSKDKKQNFEEMLKEDEELQKRLEELKAYLLAHAEELRKFHEQYGESLVSILNQLSSCPAEIIEEEPEVKQNPSEPEDESEFPVTAKARSIMKKYIKAVKNLEKQIEKMTERDVAGRKSRLELGQKATDTIGGAVVENLGGLLQFIPELGGAGETIGAAVSEFSGSLTEYLFNKAFESMETKHVFNKRLAKDFLLVFGNELMSIVTNYFIYDYYKKEPVKFMKALKKGKIYLINYVYICDKIYTPDVDRDFADKLNFMGSVQYYCCVKRCFNWNGQIPVENAVIIQANKAVLLELGAEEEECDSFMRETIEKYKFAAPQKGVKMEDYYIAK